MLKLVPHEKAQLWFQNLVKTITPRIYPYISFLQSDVPRVGLLCSNTICVPDLFCSCHFHQGIGTDAHSRAQINREKLLIPNLIFQVEHFEHFLIKLSKQSKVLILAFDLTSYTLST